MAVLAGTVLTIGLYLLLAALGVGSGLTIFPPVTSVNPAAHVSVGAALTWSLFALIAWSLGGWAAGRLSVCQRSGLLHGALVWSLTLALALPLLLVGTKLWWSRVAKTQDVIPLSLVGGIIEHDLANSVVIRRQDELGSFIEEAVQSVPTNATPKAATRAQREVGLAVNKLFAPVNAAALQANRSEAINILTAYTEMSAGDATTTIDAWIISYKSLEVELDKVRAQLDKFETDRNLLKLAAEQKNQAIAEQSAHHLAHLSVWAFFALLIGLVGASLGGKCGADCAARTITRPRSPVIPG